MSAIAACVSAPVAASTEATSTAAGAGAAAATAAGCAAGAGAAGAAAGVSSETGAGGSGAVAAPSVLPDAMKSAQKLVWSALSWYRTGTTSVNGAPVHPVTPLADAIFARLASPATMSVMSRKLSLVDFAASGLNPYCWLKLVS